MRVHRTECGVNVSTVIVTAAQSTSVTFPQASPWLSAQPVSRSACLQVLIHKGLFGVGLVISGALQGHNGTAAKVVAAKPSRRGRTHFVPQRGRAPWLP